MTAYASSHDTAHQELAELEERIQRQEALIERLTKAGASVEKASDRLLQMQLVLLDMRGHKPSAFATAA
jgi:uncharacterized coiled-coil protein SlyX